MFKGSGIKGHDVWVDSDFLLIQGGAGRDLFKGVGIKGHDVRVDSDFLLIQGGVGRDLFKGVGIKGHDVWVDSDFLSIQIISVWSWKRNVIDNMHEEQIEI